MDVLLILSGVLVVAFFALVAARDFVIDHVTSRSLGSLAPGYAATRRGYYTYAALVGVIGLILLALYIGNPWLVLLWISLFLATSIAAIAGEVRTYRELKR